MTKKKAIEAAMKRWMDMKRGSFAVDAQDIIVYEAVNHAYAAGRIAGLREAAVLVPASGMIYGWFVVNKIRDHANTLAKKARAGK